MNKGKARKKLKIPISTLVKRELTRTAAFITLVFQVTNTNIVQKKLEKKLKFVKYQNKLHKKEKPLKFQRLKIF